MSEQHSSSIKSYLLVFGALALLTGLTVLLSTMGLSHSTGIILAILIALTKCSLIVAFFMHLRFERKSIYFILFSALFFIAVLVFALIPDIGIASK